MKRFINFIAEMKNKEWVQFATKVLFFYCIFMVLWLFYVVTRDAGTPAFIYEQF